MKPVVICLIAGGLGFGLMGFQTGLFQEQLPASGLTGPASTPAKGASTGSVAVPNKNPLGQRAKFPGDLAPAVRQQPVPQAAERNPKSKSNKMVVLKSTGAVHAWDEMIREDWKAETVEETDIVLVVQPQKKTFVNRIDYPGAPPIDRYQFDLEVYVVEAKTGTVLAVKHFRQMPRQIRQVEEHDLTIIGSPIPFRTVFAWMAHQARAGWPYEAESGINVTVSD